jgi:hypothetical protein
VAKAPQAAFYLALEVSRCLSGCGRFLEPKYAQMWHSKSFCQQFGLLEAAIEAEFLDCDIRCTHRRAALLTRLRRYRQGTASTGTAHSLQMFP